MLSKRIMAKIVAIDKIAPIAGADAIEVAVVGGWSVVVKRGEYAVGDRAIYVEIDAFLPAGNAAWDFLVEKSAREFEGVRGHVLRTVRLRGQLSQGLLLSMNALGTSNAAQADAALPLGTDVSDALGICKYEAPVPAQLSGTARGVFPARVPKTDQERIQNLSVELAQWHTESTTWEITEKLEGTSCSFIWLDGELHVCSRNLDLLDTPGNVFWQLARTLNLEEQLRTLYGTNSVALQGEVVGPGVQGNLYRLEAPAFYLFDVYDVQAGQYLAPAQRRALAHTLGVAHAPVLDEAFTLSPAYDMTTLLAMADGASQLLATQAREGIVFKRADASFKIVSNAYLLKQK